MDHTRQVGSIVSFDVNIRPTLWTSPATIQETIASAVERADILKVSADEIEYTNEQSFASSEPLERRRLNALGDALLERGPRLVIITLGANGALLLTAKHRVEVPSLPVRPVDTTGAGDAFMGAVLYQLVQHGCQTPSDLLALSEHNLNNLGSFANNVAGLSTTRYGGISSFPFMHEISGFSAP